MKLQLKLTDTSSVSSQGRSGFRDGLDRTGHHDLGTTGTTPYPHFCTRPDQRTRTVAITDTALSSHTAAATPRQKKTTNKTVKTRKFIHHLVPSHLRSLTFFYFFFLDEVLGFGLLCTNPLLTTVV